MSSAPSPLVPAEVDLRDFPFTPIFRSRLFGSGFHANATDAEWRAGVTLWLKSWDQVPAGTLPTDDVALCRLAELGRDTKAWKKVRERALRGWRECTDGRLHHAVVAEGVLEAWSKRRTASSKGKAGATARWGTGIGAGNATANATAIENDAAAIAQAMPGDSNREGEGREETGREESNTAPQADAAIPSPPSAEPQPETEKTPRRKFSAVPDNFPFQDDIDKALAFWSGKGRTDISALEQYDKFRDHHISHGSRMADWPAAWGTWFRNALQFTKPPVVPFVRPGQIREFTTEEIMSSRKPRSAQN